MRTNDDFTAPEEWKDLFKLSRLNALVQWDLVADGYVPDLAIKWLSDAEIQDIEQRRCCVGQAFDPPPWLNPEPNNIDNVEDAIPQVMPAPEGEIVSSYAEAPVLDQQVWVDSVECKCPVHSTRGIWPRELENFQMIGHPSFMESIKARMAAHDNYVL
eukprot:5038218-Ditylum_brightwellii.AAC.1